MVFFEIKPDFRKKKSGKKRAMINAHVCSAVVLLLLAVRANVGKGAECGAQCQRDVLQDALSSHTIMKKETPTEMSKKEQKSEHGVPATSVARGERPHPAAPNLYMPGKGASEGLTEPRNPASQLYAELMAQMQHAQTPTIAQLLATAVCHAQPRSAAAWQGLADIELQLSDPRGSDPSVYSFLRANFIAAMLEDEMEWWEETGAGETADDEGRKGDAGASVATPGASTIVRKIAPRALLSANERAREWFFEGEYEKAKKYVKTTLKDPKGKQSKEFLQRIEMEMELVEPTLKKLMPLVARWKASGSHDYPPMTHVNPNAVAAFPDIWKSDRALPGTMRAAFVTPIFVANLVDEGAVTKDFNDRLAAGAVVGFEAFLETPAAFNKKTNQFYDATTLNDQFWIAQKETKLTSTIPEVAAVMKHFFAGASRYLSEWGLPPADYLSELLANDTDYGAVPQPWFSIHGNHSDHLQHVHFASRVAVVYYPKVQPGDGRLVFEDPRGARYDQFSAEDCNPTVKGVRCSAVPHPFPPFAGNRHYHTPRSGDLVIFPGWLYHSVERAPTDAGEYRVSLSFNVDGNWQATIP